ncbi:hypothetical protein KJ742_04675 [Patescibacteria group bacterium]|nr:hypothetical protein [Patescibacteria group bacterium]MBU1683213.1 hypothetical protein [Patescibacteria group bacterium]MBU1934570.1 hypothetical protein [Patescibacteria group bacterium]
MMREVINYSQASDRVLGEASALLHPNAREELESNYASIRKWLIVHLSQLLRRSGDMDASVSLNPMNEQGYGLQTLSILPKGPNTDDLYTHERGPFTLNLGIIAPGMLNGDAQTGEVEFRLDSEAGQVLHNLSGHSLLIRTVERGGDQTFGRCSDEFPAYSNFNARGPDVALRVVMETTQLDQIRRRVHGVLNHGVYASEPFVGVRMR